MFVSTNTFYPITIGEYTYQINKNDHILINEFSDIIPLYSEEHGMYCQVLEKATGKYRKFVFQEATVLTLNNVVSGDCTKDEYYAEYVKKRQTYLRDILIRNIYAKGFEIPSPIQSLTCLEIVNLRDAIIQSNAGTGKTLMTLMSTLFHFDIHNPSLQCIFLTNSWEVAGQFETQIRELLKFPDGSQQPNISICIGQKNNNAGSFQGHQRSRRAEEAQISRAQIAVGTMGKMFEYFNRGVFKNCSNIKTIVIDEFDNLVNSNGARSGTISTGEQFKFIMQRIPNNAQRIFCSATKNEESLEAVAPYLRNPAECFLTFLNSEDVPLEKVKQYYVECEYERSINCKLYILLDLLKQIRIGQCIVFANEIKTAIQIKNFIDSNPINVPSAVFHGELSSAERTNIHNAFKSGKLRLLVSTDVTARGFDIQGVNLVINFDMPHNQETYIHRIGRSGRYGRYGVAISFIIVGGAKFNEMAKIQQINEDLGTTVLPLCSDLENLLS